MRVRRRLAWGISLGVHLALLALLLWWLEAKLPKPHAVEKPVPLNLAMLAAPSAPPVQEAQEQAEEVSPVEPPPEIIAAPPVPEPVAEVSPEPPKPEPPKPETPVKPKPAPPKPTPPKEAKPPAKPVASKPKVVEAQVQSSESVATAVVPVQNPVPLPVPATVSSPVADPAAEDAYKALLRNRVDAHKQYPRLSRRMGEEGRVVVEFSVSASGEVSGLRIKSGSGSERLDEAALQAVRDAAPFPPFPEGVRRTEWSFSLPLVFSLDS
ncbi:MAG: energy transducer TonB [Pseudomonadota bacterium]